MLPVNVIMPADKEQMALTLNGKKRNVKRKDFLILAENLGISEKVAIGLMKQIVKHRDAFGEEVKASYVSQEMKEQLWALIQRRMAVFDGIS